MKPMTIAGVALILLGVLALVYQGITYTSRETILDLGPLQATADRQKTLPLSPVLGVVAVAGGVMLLVSGTRRRA
jgi:drug/metabolite transporter (DMT)-like permease